MFKHENKGMQSQISSRNSLEEKRQKQYITNQCSNTASVNVKILVVQIPFYATADTGKGRLSFLEVFDHQFLNPIVCFSSFSP